MPDSMDVENPIGLAYKALLRRLRALGMSELAIASTVPILTLLGAHSHWVALVSLFALGTNRVIASEKLRAVWLEITRGRHVDVGLLESSLTKRIDDLDELAQEVQEAVERASAELSAAQIEQIAALLLAMLESQDEEWLEMLRSAVGVTVSESVDEATRQSVITQLKQMRPAHMRVLGRIYEAQGEKGYAEFRMDPLLPSTLFIGLYQAGFVKTSGVVHYRAVGVTDGTGEVTLLGEAALTMVGMPVWSAPDRRYRIGG